MNSAYLISLAVLGTIAAIILSPDLFLEVSYLTLGVGGFVVIIAANVFIVALCFAPLAFSASSVSKFLRLVMSLGLLALWLAGPKALSEIGLRSGMSSFAAQDQALVGTIPSAAGNGVELRWLNHDRRPYAYSMSAHAACDDLCVGLLYGGNVDWVRLVFPSAGDTNGELAITFVRGVTDDCADQLCVVYAESDEALPVATVLTENLKIHGDTPFLFSLLNDLNSHRRVSLFRGAISENDLMWRQTEIRAQTVVNPTILAADRKGMSLIGASVERNTIDLNVTLDAAGISLWPKERVERQQRRRFDPLTGGVTARLTSFLNLEEIDIIPGGRLRPADTEISLWFDAARNAETLSPDDVALLARILAEPRLEKRPSFINLFRTRPETHDPLLSWFFDEYLNGVDPNADVIADFGIALATTAFRAGQLERYAEEYQVVLNRFPEQPILLRALGRFGFDPAASMREFYLHDPEKNAFHILDAICIGDPVWDSQTLDLAREIVLLENTPSRPIPSSAMERGLDVLYAFGERDEAVAIVTASSWSTKERLLRGLPDYQNSSDVKIRESCIR